MASILLNSTDFNIGHLELTSLFSSPDKARSTTKSLTVLIFSSLVLSYVLSWAQFYWSRNYGKSGELPPRYPSFIPWIGGAVTVLFNGQGFLDAATSFRGKLTACRVRFLGKEHYFLQDRQSVIALWKQNSLSSPIEPYILVLRYFFGMKKDALSVYEQDNSGPFHKPFAGSKVKPNNRVDWITHQEILKGLTGGGLQPLTRRTANAILKRVETSPVGDDWVEFPDLLKFYQELVGTSIIESLAGPTLFELYPNFSEDFWKFDKCLPKLAKGIPDLLISGSARVRKNLLEGLKKYYLYAREHFSTSSLDADGDFDPYWGSGLMKARQRTLLAVDHQDDDSVASADLGLIWASVSNIVPSSMMATIHTFKDSSLLARVRSSLEEDASVLENLDEKALAKNDLLVSIYCETLRMYVKSYFLTSNQHADIPVGRWTIPRQKVVFVNSSMNHMDEEFWNTQNGLHPVNAFWGDRFIVDPSDPSSGPIKPEIVHEVMSEKKKLEASQQEKPYVSMNGLEGSWIPYGGGHAICPGRFLAKSAILLSTALMVENFDMEILPENIEMSYAKFGLGTLRPKKPIPFRIRRRSKVESS